MALGAARLLDAASQLDALRASSGPRGLARPAAARRLERAGTAAVTPASTTSTRSSVGGSRRPMRAPTYPPTTEPAASSTIAAQSRSATTRKISAGDDVGGQHRQRLEGVDDPQLEVESRARGRPPSSRPTRRRSSRRTPRSGWRRTVVTGDIRVARLGRVRRPSRCRSQRGDPRLRADQQAGEEDQPRHDRLEDARAAARAAAPRRRTAPTAQVDEHGRGDAAGARAARAR